MAALLDVNVLVALFDPAHTHHELAHDWFGAEREAGWATCPLTENGFARVVSNPAYPGRRTELADARERLAVLCRAPEHRFWPDSISIRDPGRIVDAHVRGHRQLTDVYLLGLAVERAGRLVTFDRSIQIRAVNGATREHLVVLEAPHA